MNGIGSRGARYRYARSQKRALGVTFTGGSDMNAAIRWRASRQSQEDGPNVTPGKGRSGLAKK